MDPWKSWVTVGLVGAGIGYYYYTQSIKTKRGRGRPHPIIEQNQRRTSETRNESKDKRKKKNKQNKASDTSEEPTGDAATNSLASSQANSINGLKKRKGSTQQPSRLAESSAVEVGIEQNTTIDNENGGDEGLSNADFAKEFSEVKEGTSLQKPMTKNQKKKMRKQGNHKGVPSEAIDGVSLKANGLQGSHEMSTASSTTGADADDDLSLPMSPDIGATRENGSSGRDVSDMLEVPEKGPSILRITEPINFQQPRPSMPKKAAPEPETKKQRQRRQKNEDKKALCEDAEKERHLLLEQQRRTVREAEGRPAKNGLNVSKSTSNSVWDKSNSSPPSSITGAAAVMPGPSSEQRNTQLLDTFEDNTSTATTNSSMPSTDTNTSTDKAYWRQDMPSEEEQIRRLSEMDSDGAWTVATGGKGKRKTAAGMMNPSTAQTTTRDNVKSHQELPDFSADNKDFPINGKATAKGDDSVTPSADGDKTVEIPSFLNGRTPGSSSNNALEEDPYKAVVNNDQEVKEIELYGKDAWDKYVRYLPARGTYRKETFKGGPASPEHIARMEAARYTYDRAKWKRSNIHEHPDYDENWPYAIIGHPENSDWEAGPEDPIWPPPNFTPPWDPKKYHITF